MERAVQRLAPQADIVVMAAAVADFRPDQPALEKLKKRDGTPTLTLVPNPDILAQLPRLAPDALRVGFAAETSAVVAEGERKLATKGAHLLIANDVSRPGIGFASDDNEVVVIRRNGAPRPLARASKAKLGEQLVELFARELAELRSGHHDVRR
jgi:phosphopantothenoylcysteine decarboxylase/phosphopantothenate--cysteine ligase